MSEVQVKEKGEKGGKVRSKKQEGRVDMTPMVDLGFLLITFFILTITFSKPNVMDLGLPAKPKGPQQQSVKTEIKPSNSITFIIGKDDRIFYHQQAPEGLNAETLLETSYDKDGIEKVIDQSKKKAENPAIFTVIIKPLDDANYKNFVDILDEMAVTKSDKYGISDIKPFEQSVYDEKMK